MNARGNRPAWFVLTQHWVSLAGVFLVTTAGISWLFVLPLQIRGHVDNPYIGIIVFLILPIIFFAGLALQMSEGAETLTLEHYQAGFRPLLYGIVLVLVLTCFLKETGPATRRT